MKAIIISSSGGPEVLIVTDLPDPATSRQCGSATS
jgi:NADPH:quinone reductase-like Zn-dependent oxidoreductase